jgi:hypothetical protein
LHHVSGTIGVAGTWPALVACPIKEITDGFCVSLGVYDPP